MALIWIYRYKEEFIMFPYYAAMWEIPFTNVYQYLILIVYRRLLNQEAAYSKGLLPSQVINVGGDNR